MPSLFIYIYKHILNIESIFNETVTTTKKCAKQEEYKRNHVYFIFLFIEDAKNKIKQKKQGHLKYLNELYKMLELNNLPYMETLMRSKTLLNK